MRHSRLILICCGLIILLTGIFAEGHKSLRNARTWQHRQPLPVEDCSHDEDTFCTHLPLVQIWTNGTPIQEDGDTLCTITVTSTEGKNHHLYDEPDFEVTSEIHYRGNSSLHFDKRQYRLDFVKREKPSEDMEQTVNTTSNGAVESDLTQMTPDDQKVMGMPKESDWVLNGPYLDKTLMRNYLMYNLSGEIMDWAPNVRFCEVFLDDQYQGVYLMVETIKVGEERLDITPYDEKSRECSYVLNRERKGDGVIAPNSFDAYTGRMNNEVFIDYPKNEKLTKESLDYITRDLSEFERTVSSVDYDDFRKGYSSMIDVDSFVDYMIINEFSLNHDAGNISTYAYKDVRGKLTMGPVWDFNNTFDNYQDVASPFDDLSVITFPNDNWYSMLMKDEVFVERVIQRYHELRKDILSDENLISLVDEIRAYLGPAVDRNFEVWGYTFQKKLYRRPAEEPKSYEEAIQQLKDCIIERGHFLDENIEILRQFSAESAVKEYN